MIRLCAAVIAILTLTAAASPVHASDESAGTASSSLSRPAALPALYVSYAALQAFDMYSTQQALARGAREANPSDAAGRWQSNGVLGGEGRGHPGDDRRRRTPLETQAQPDGRHRRPRRFQCCCGCCCHTQRECAAQ